MLRTLLNHLTTWPPPQPLVDAAFQRCVQTAGTFLFSLLLHLLWHEAWSISISPKLHQCTACLQPLLLSCAGQNRTRVQGAAQGEVQNGISGNECKSEGCRGKRQWKRKRPNRIRRRRVTDQTQQNHTQKKQQRAINGESHEQKAASQCAHMDDMSVF